MSGEWQTPNDPDIPMEISDAALEKYGRRMVMWRQVTWVDPETRTTRCLRFPPETPDHVIRQRWRLALFQEYGDRVIPPEHRGDEF